MPCHYENVMSDAMCVFDRDLIRCRRQRAAAGFVAHDFLFREVGGRLVSRLDDLRQRFPVVLELGCRTGILAELVGDRGGIECLVRSELSEAMAQKAVALWPSALTVIADEEQLPFRAGLFDLVMSNLVLHWVNDLPGTLVQVHRVLKPGGIFLASMVGGHSLSELRTALAMAESAQEGVVRSLRISPFVADARTAGTLLQRAGFAMQVVDCDTIIVRYANPMQLLRDLRGTGESNAIRERRRTPLRRGTLQAALDHYRIVHTDSDGRVPATFQILYLTAWTTERSSASSRERAHCRT